MLSDGQQPRLRSQTLESPEVWGRIRGLRATADPGSLPLGTSRAAGSRARRSRGSVHLVMVRIELVVSVDVVWALSTVVVLAVVVAVVNPVTVAVVARVVITVPVVVVLRAVVLAGVGEPGGGEYPGGGHRSCGGDPSHSEHSNSRRRFVAADIRRRALPEEPTKLSRRDDASSETPARRDKEPT